MGFLDDETKAKLPKATKFGLVLSAIEVAVAIGVGWVVTGILYGISVFVSCAVKEER